MREMCSKHKNYYEINYYCSNIWYIYNIMELGSNKIRRLAEQLK